MNLMALLPTVETPLADLLPAATPGQQVRL